MLANRPLEPNWKWNCHGFVLPWRRTPEEITCQFPILSKRVICTGQQGNELIQFKFWRAPKTDKGRRTDLRRLNENMLHMAVPQRTRVTKVKLYFKERDWKRTLEISKDVIGTINSTRLEKWARDKNQTTTSAADFWQDVGVTETPHCSISASEETLLWCKTGNLNFRAAQCPQALSLVSVESRLLFFPSTETMHTKLFFTPPEFGLPQ